MLAPEGIEVPTELVCRLRRSLYGMKQLAAVWFTTIRSVFRSMGFVQCRADPCCFVRRSDLDSSSSGATIVLYLDDLLVGSAHEGEIELIRQSLAAHFTVKVLGDTHHALGMEIKYDRGKGELLLKQKQFIAKMVARFDQQDVNPVRNRVVFGQDLAPDSSHAMLESANRYRELISALLYVANATSSDISVALSILSQYLDTPTETYWRAAVRVLRYIMGTDSHGLRFANDTENIVTAYCDANWGNDKVSRRSTSGVLIIMGGAPVVYKSKRQSTMAVSSVEAEYLSLALATQDVAWLRFLLEEVGIILRGPSTICTDNQSAIQIATNHGYIPRAKHIDIRAHFVRDHVESGTIELKYVLSKSQLAEFLTKMLPTPRIAELRNSSGIRGALDYTSDEVPPKWSSAIKGGITVLREVTLRSTVIIAERA
ncbi:hypothetical protein PybrP1_003633 [[Pythium] brassicae (nom. inval.)]|nr:hypothetical protein PybrP1_003633 [[Pythium] brassicae (nom. inval.)]